MCGDAISARNDLDRVQRMGQHPADLLPSLEPRARAWAMVAAAEPESARQLLTDAVRRLTATGLAGAAWQCAHDLLSLDRPGPMLELAAIDGEPMSALRHRHARAEQSRDVDELAEIVTTYEEAGGIRWAAECAAALAHSLSRAGSKQAERRASEHAASLAERCIGLEIPSLTTGAAAKLSARELEIAQLAARGLTSRAIGDRLGLSMRTVDNHLARCYDKLGARNRAELAELLGS
jgi:DNA-binding CsgD family transcriptional regulator